MIQVKQIKKRFGDHEVLKGIDLTINQGEVVVLLGKSGSGKTTLLRCMNFLERADEGSITIAGKEFSFNKATKQDILEVRRNTAMAFQQYNLFINKTAVENIMEGLVIARKMPKQEAYAIAISLLEKVGLREREGYYPHQLSGGQQQRVGIARALALNPEIMLFDEPTSSLDPELVSETLDVIRTVVQEGRTMIITTHEMDFAYEIADKVVFMENGRIVEQGTPHEVFNETKEERTKQFLARFSYRRA